MRKNSDKQKRPSEPDTKSKAIAALMLERKERENRAGKAIMQICEKENVAIMLENLRFVNGTFEPTISIVAQSEKIP